MTTTYGQGLAYQRHAQWAFQHRLKLLVHEGGRIKEDN